MTEYKQIWSELDQDKRIKENKELLARLVTDRSEIKIFFATEGYLGHRYILIKLPNKWSNDIVQNLPIWKGISIEQASMNILDHNISWYLIIKNNFEEIKNIFEAFIGNVCDNLLQADEEVKILEIVEQTLSHWKSFFEEYGFTGLSDSAQRGLYGELWFLRCLIKESPLSTVKLVERWKGPNRKTHDFSNKSIAVEIKTSTAKKHHKFQVSGEKQLDDRGLKKLYLVFLSFAEMESTGESLNGIIEWLIVSLDAFPAAQNLFKEKLFQVGYSIAHSSLYTTGFINREVRTFLVQEGFPRLLSENLPDGLGDLTYSVAVASCRDYEIPLNLAISDISGDD
ncbi:PD-(D/E)XK motif protein [Cohnella sp. WQ 127256]|uniref:PD-(D/E)XK motif protein n=1 Tax=Cohnella sp. WQ 127256 TaxID=2938790 RepID=UPI00211778C5|nr:PD-(D/E)XK motif protein [Cohnella sp. WQ 127256]